MHKFMLDTSHVQADDTGLAKEMSSLASTECVMSRGGEKGLLPSFLLSSLTKGDLD